MVWYDEFGSAFWLTIAGILTGCVGLVVKAGIKSKCSSVNLGCFSCTRDVRAEVEVEEFNVVHGIRESPEGGAG